MSVPEQTFSLPIVKEAQVPEPAPLSTNFFEDVSFVGKLAMMLQDPIALSFVSWSSNKDSIVIFDRLKFASQILPRYFITISISSFTHQDLIQFRYLQVL